MSMGSNQPRSTFGSGGLIESHRTWLIKPFFVTVTWASRRTLLVVHVLTDSTFVGPNPVCTGLWFHTGWNQATTLMEYLFTSPISSLAWTNVLITVVLLLGVFGSSPYRTVTPHTPCLGWSILCQKVFTRWRLSSWLQSPVTTFSSFPVSPWNGCFGFKGVPVRAFGRVIGDCQDRRCWVFVVDDRGLVKRDGLE